MADGPVPVNPPGDGRAGSIGPPAPPGTIRHMEAPNIAGYGLCRCGQLHPTIALSRSGGTCPDCEHMLFDRVERIQVVDGDQRYLIPVGRNRPRNRGNESTRHRNATRAARAAAMRRLKNLCGDLFRVLYAQERAKRGLEAFPIEGPPLTADAADAALDQLVGA